MRRTLFVFPRDLLPAAWGSASARVAAALARPAGQGGRARPGWPPTARRGWTTAEAATLARLAGRRRAAPPSELREQVPELAARLDIGPGKSYGANVPIAPRVLTQLGRRGQDRARPQRRPLAHRPAAVDRDGDLAGRACPSRCRGARGVRRAGRAAGWRTFGPGTEADIVWWLGATKTAVRAALADVGAVEVVARRRARPAGCCPTTSSREPEVEPWAALLPVLDPTVMGWKERDFYLGAARAELFDTNGNAGTTAWWDGRVVGCWVQDPDGVVVRRACSRTSARDGARRARRRGRAADRLAGRVTG